MGIQFSDAPVSSPIVIQVASLGTGHQSTVNLTDWEIYGGL